MEIEELVKQYEALWENDAPMEQIVEFCRQQNTVIDRRNTLVDILRQSKWGEMVLMPLFLKHLASHDDCLLKNIVQYWHVCDAFKRTYSLSRILSMKECFPDKYRAFFWTLICTRNDFAIMTQNAIMFVDNRDVRTVIIRSKLPGYELIPEGLEFGKTVHSAWWKIPKEIDNAIADDSVSLLEMRLTLYGKKFTKLLFQIILSHNAFNILDHMLKCRLRAVTNILSPQDILVNICAFASKCEGAIKVLDTLEQLYPGISKTKDKLGNTPLWYCLYRSGREKLEEALIKYGCDPDARNHLNLSYNLCKEFVE